MGVALRGMAMVLGSIVVPWLIVRIPSLYRTSSSFDIPVVFWPRFRGFMALEAPIMSWFEFNPFWA